MVRGIISKSVGAALAVHATVVAAWAQAPMAPAAVLAGSCANCHGPSGVSPGAIPSIDNQDAATMAARLNGFRRGEIEATVMNRIARGFTEAEIEAISQYFASLKR